MDPLVIDAGKTFETMNLATGEVIAKVIMMRPHNREKIIRQRQGVFIRLDEIEILIRKIKTERDFSGKSLFNL